MENNHNTPLAHRICDRLEIPEDVCRNCGRIELISNCYALVDGCKSVLEYDDSVIKLNLGKNSITFHGTNLAIRSLSLEQAVIDGFIAAIDFG